MVPRKLGSDGTDSYGFTHATLHPLILPTRIKNDAFSPISKYCDQVSFQSSFDIQFHPPVRSLPMLLRG